jgi:hypothetical protein
MRCAFIDGILDPKIRMKRTLRKSDWHTMSEYCKQIERIADPLIRAGVTAAIEKNLLPAAVETAYRGHFNVVADGSHFGGDHTWPGLDSWEMAGAYLLLGRRELVHGYYEYVRDSQRVDGNIPFAIAPADAKPAGMDTYGRGLRWPEDVYERAGRKWIGLFHHWQMNVNPLSVLGAMSYVLTAREMLAAGETQAWLEDYLPSIERAMQYVLSRRGENGLIGGAGFYIECPPRDQWDGITQCYAVHAMRQLAEMWQIAGATDRAARWAREAAPLAARFSQVFWRGDHFAEYVHPQRGVVDAHGLSDVNWAAVAWELASPEQLEALWPRLMREQGFWTGGMPTQLVTRPQAYEPWEYPEPLPFEHVHGPVYDVAAMGRVWFLEAMACLRMKQHDRLRESVRLVCAMGQSDGWKWHERYHAQPDGTVKSAGPGGYCEYAAVLVRVVLGNLEGFS